MKETVLSRLEIERNGSLIPVEAQGVVFFAVDKHYGEDADGNRGYSKTIVHEVQDIAVFDDDANELKLSPVEEEFIANQLTIKFLEE